MRPLLYMPEKDVRYFAKREQLPVITSPCPADGNTERANMEKLMMDLERMSKGIRQRIFCAMQKGEIDGFKRVPKRAPRIAIKDEE